MSRKPREAILFLLDIGCSMKQFSGDSKTTFFTSSKECISQIIQRKIFSCSRDELGLIVFGSEKTENTLATDHEYRNIAIITENLQYANWDFLRSIHDLDCSNCNYGDWLDAIVVAMEFMQQKTSGFQSIYHCKIVLFSNFERPVLDDQVDAIVAGLKTSNISLFVIGPDINKTEFSNGMAKSDNQKAGENLITKIIREVNGVICSFEEAFAELMYFQRKSVKPTPWNALFTISNKIKIPVQMFKKITEPSYRKWSTKILDDEDAGVVKERAYVRFDEDKEMEIEVPKDDVINAYQFGSTVVPFSDIDKESMRYSTGSKGLYFIGCTRKDRIPLHVLIGDGSYIILAKSDDNTAKKTLEAFVQALFERNYVGVARRIYNHDTTTTIGALFPVVTEESKYFVFAQLPFAEDEHLFKFPSLEETKLSEEQSKAVDDLINMMDLDVTNDIADKYDITKVYDHNEQFIFKYLSYKALYPDRSLPEEMKLMGLDVLKANPRLLEECEQPLTLIKNLFSLEEVPEKSKRKAFKKRPLEEVENDVPLSTSLFHNSPLQMSHVNRDFISSIQNKISVDEFEKIKIDINAMVDSSSLNLSKILTTLQYLRKIYSDDAEPYNKWIQSMEKQFRDTNNLYIWNRIVEEKLNSINEGMITNHDKTSELLIRESEEADSLYGTESSNCIDDLLDNI